MIKLKSFFFFIILISFLGRADSETLNFLNLSEIINEAKLNNPEIQAAKEKYEAVIQRTSPFRYLMDPWLGIEFEGDMRMYSLTQELPFPTKLSTKSKLAKIGAAKAFEEYREKEQAIIKRVKEFYARLFLVDKEIMVMREVRDFLNQILQVAMRNYALNKTPQSDVLRTQVELARIDNELLALQDEKSVMISELYFLLNRQNDSVFGTIKEIEIKDTNFEIEKLYELAKEHRPELKLFSFGINQAKTSLSLSKQEYLPDFMVKLQQKEIDSKFANRSIMFGLTLPLWFLGKQNKMVQEMKAELKMAEAEYRAMENMALAQVKEKKIMVDKHKREIDLYKKNILPQVEATLKSSLKAYEVNQVDFMTLLDNEKMLVESELKYYQAQSDCFIALAELEEAVGTSLGN